MPLHKARLIWQGAPPLLWAPISHVAAPDSWHADTLIRAGQFTPPPPPDPAVPLHLLTGLKRIFDPRGWLPEPAWLEQAFEAES